MPDEPTPGLYFHPKSRGYYLVLGVAQCSTNGPGENLERSVVYYSLDRKALRYRELSEFMSPGRFLRATAENPENETYVNPY